MQGMYLWYKKQKKCYNKITIRRYSLKNKNHTDNFIKVIYFDEVSASDYVTIKNGGDMDWTTKENEVKRKSASGEASGSVSAGFRFLNFAKAAFSGEIKASTDVNSSRVIENIFSNALLTDYISLASNDPHIQKYSGKSVFIPENSLSQYKMVSSFIDLISAEQFKELGVNIDKLNDVILGKQGYFPLLLGDYKKTDAVLRFNISAFKNNYNLSDLTKMDLQYFGIKVGKCTKEDLTFNKMFTFSNEEQPLSPKDIIDGSSSENTKEKDFMDVYDVVLAGVKVKNG